MLHVSNNRPMKLKKTSITPPYRQPPQLSVSPLYSLSSQLQPPSSPSYGPSCASSSPWVPPFDAPPAHLPLAGTEHGLPVLHTSDHRSLRDSSSSDVHSPVLRGPWRLLVRIELPEICWDSGSPQDPDRNCRMERPQSYSCRALDQAQGNTSAGECSGCSRWAFVGLRCRSRSLHWGIPGSSFGEEKPREGGFHVDQKMNLTT